MSMLLESAPKNVFIAGTRYKINSNFRTAIKFEILMTNQNQYNDAEVLLKALELFFPMLPPEEYAEEAVNAILWFYQCGKTPQACGHENGGSQKRIYSFEWDDDYIYAAFLEQYGIDLQNVKYLHWWKFKAMFKALKSDTEFIKIMGYRSVVIDKNMSAEQKRFYQKMKKLHKIPIEKSEREKLDLIEEALMSGKSINNLL